MEKGLHMHGHSVLMGGTSLNEPSLQFFVEVILTILLEISSYDADCSEVLNEPFKLIL